MDEDLFRKAAGEVFNPSCQSQDRELVVYTREGGMGMFDEAMKNTLYGWQRKELWKTREDVFRNHNVTVEEFRRLGEMIKSEDVENLTLARLLIDELSKRPRLYPQWSR